MPLRVILADDHPVVRKRIRALLEGAGVEVVAEASNGVTSVAQARTYAPDVAVLDISMPELNGIEAAREMLSCTPRVAVVLLSMHDDEEHVLQALRGGIRGYVVKTQAEQDLVDAIRTVAADGTYLSSRVSHIVNACLSGAPSRRSTAPSLAPAR